MQLRTLLKISLFVIGGFVAAIPWLGESSAQLVTPTSCPNQNPAFTAGGNVFGRLSTQWNQYFSAKVDSVNGVLCNPTVIGGNVFGEFPPHTVLANPTNGTAIPFPTVSATGTISINNNSIDANVACTDVSDAACQSGNNVFTATNKFNTVNGTVRTVSGTTDTLSAADCGRGVSYTSGSTVTVTTFANAVDAATRICTIGLVQKGAGSVTLADGAGATHVSSHSCTKAFGQGSLVSLLVTGDAPSEWVWGGDCSP